MTLLYSTHAGTPGVQHSEDRQPHIDGLRAIAVLAVIAFHAKVPQLTGGFAGVDVFFVISGYLITGILVRDMHAGAFSFTGFYARRARRLMPAGLCAIAATLLFGCAILTPRDLESLASSAVAAVFFVANYWFAAHSRYFDTATDLSPLTHLWSLAVEEQFYLLYPLFLIALMRRWGMTGVRAGAVIAAAVSLALSVCFSASLPANSFYLLPARAWELLLGGVLCLWQWRAFVPPRPSIAAASLGTVGMLMIAASLFVLSPDTTYPGYAALLPTMGAAIVLLFGRDAAWIEAWLTHPVMRRIGDFSYSAYLWHWPLIVYYRIHVGGRAFTMQETIALIAVSLLAGYLSWRVIEQRFRYRIAAPRHVAIVGAGTACMLAICAILIMHSRGLPQRVDQDIADITDREALWNWPCPQRVAGFLDNERWLCVVGDRWASARTRGIVWGDSHAEHWAPILHRIARSTGMALLVVNTGCAAYVDGLLVTVRMAGKPQYGEVCAQRNQGVRSWLARHQDVHVVVLAAAWSTHLRGLQLPEGPTSGSLDDDDAQRSLARRSAWSEHALDALTTAIATPERHVLLLGDVPRPNRYLNGCLFAERTWLLREPCGQVSQGLDAVAVRAFHAPSDRALAAVAAHHSNTAFISAVDRLCGTTRCPTVLAGEWIYMDDNHLRRDMRASTQDALIHQLQLDTALAAMRDVDAPGSAVLTHRSASPDS